MHAETCVILPDPMFCEKAKGPWTLPCPWWETVKILCWSCPFPEDYKFHYGHFSQPKAEGYIYQYDALLAANRISLHKRLWVLPFLSCTLVIQLTVHFPVRPTGASSSHGRMEAGPFPYVTQAAEGQSDHHELKCQIWTCDTLAFCHYRDVAQHVVM